MKLYPHQIDSVEYALKHRYSINGSSMGCGKTVIALEFIRRSGLDGLVVGPAFLKGTWESEAKNFGVDVNYISYTSLHKYRAEHLNQFGVWVADEMHRLKSDTTRQTKTYYQGLKAAKPKYWLGLSGTPIMNQVYDLWVPLAICSQCPEATNGLKLDYHLRTKRAFSYHFCKFQTMNIHGRRVDKFTSIKDERVEEFKRLLDDKYIRFKLEDIIKDLPEMTRKGVDLQLKPVPGLEDEFKNYIAGSKVDPTAKATSALLKAKYTSDYVLDMLEDSDESVLVFTDHIASAQEIYKRLAVAVSTKLITGATPSDMRHTAVEDFQRGQTRVIVATIGSMSVGVTLTRARHVVFNDLSWSNSTNAQAAARIHRIGQKNACFAHYMLASDTDKHIAKVLLEKQEIVEKVLG